VLGCGACSAPPVSTTTHPIERRDPTAQLASWEQGALHVTGAPPLDHAIAEALDPYSAVTASKLLDISDDGTQVLVLQGGDAMLVRRPLEAPISRTSDIDVSWARFGEHGAIDYAGDRDGTEDDRLYQRANGPPAPLVEDHGRVADPIERNGRLIWAEPTEQETALWLLESNGKARKIFSGEGAWAVIDLSADGSQLLARHTVSLESSTLYRIDIAAGHAVALTSVDPRVAAPAGAFGANGQLFAISSAGDRLNVWELMPRGTRLIAPELGWDVTQLAVSPDGSTVAFTANEDGASVLYLYDTTAHTHRTASVPTGGVISELRFAAKAPVLAFTFTDPRHPRDVFSYDLRDGRLEQWTRTELGAIAADTLVEPAHVQVRSAVDLPMLVMRPKSTRRLPVVVELHGGPEDQWLPKWSPFEQFLASRGIAVIQPNVRGSVGYGRDFAALDDGPLREAPVKDVGAVLEWIATQPDLDPHRITVLGQSYGGYLALAALIAYPDKLHAGVDIVGIADFVAFLEGTAPYRRASRRVEYGDEREPATRAHLANMSPITHAAAIRAPLVVAVGRKDPRVPPAVSDRLVDAVRGTGGTVWYLSADDEGHGFNKPTNRAALEVLITQLVER
jgi:dipeptidyl aminopeptidase/acylaminoacyl peptidase